MRLNVKYLKKLMEEKNWGIRQFAMKTGLSPSTISRILRGKRIAGAKAIEAIAKALPNEPFDMLFFLG